MSALEELPKARRWDALALAAARLGLGNFTSNTGAHRAPDDD